MPPYIIHHRRFFCKKYHDANWALAAAAWLARQPAGRYGMDDVLGLHESAPARPLARPPERK